MSKSSIALAFLVWSIAIVCGSFFYGEHVQRNADAATSNAQTVEKLTSIINTSTQLANDAAQASKDMRLAIAARNKADEKTTKDFQDALSKTAGSRVNCRFDDAVMQQLDAARQRAAEATASGIRDSMPGTGSANR